MQGIHGKCQEGLRGGTESHSHHNSSHKRDEFEVRTQLRASTSNDRGCGLRAVCMYIRLLLKVSCPSYIRVHSSGAV